MASIDPELLQLLKRVSRSFYLSVRFLPEKIRPAIALGYLAARASDTIADTNLLAAAERLDTLKQLRAQLFTLEPELQRALAVCAKRQPNGSEQLLLEQIEIILDCIKRLPTQQQSLLKEVLDRIMRGQVLDIERFELASSLRALRSAEELEEYIYLVAGCVGEFWTKLCLQQFPQYSRIGNQEIISLGIEYGKGLQLVNVLRDFPQDVRSGRSYLPIANPGALAADLRPAKLVFEKWQGVAIKYLESGVRYVRLIRPIRVRFACAVPVLIGIETLKKMKAVPLAGKRVKVSRATVYWLLLVSLLVAAIPGADKVFMRTKVTP